MKKVFLRMSSFRSCIFPPGDQAIVLVDRNRFSAGCFAIKGSANAWKYGNAPGHTNSILYIFPCSSLHNECLQCDSAQGTTYRTVPYDVVTVLLTVLIVSSALGINSTARVNPDVSLGVPRINLNDSFE